MRIYNKAQPMAAGRSQARAVVRGVRGKAMRILCFILASSVLSGCVGVAVGTYGTFESESESFKLTDKRNEFGYGMADEVITKEHLMELWGAPNEIFSAGSCEVLTYYDGYTWSGVGAFFVVVPVPLLVPSGRDENRFYFRNGEALGLVREYGEVTGMFGFMCGSNECRAAAGPVNTGKRRKVNVGWCD